MGPMKRKQGTSLSGIPVSDIGEDEISEALELGLRQAHASIPDPIGDEISQALELGIQNATASPLGGKANEMNEADQIERDLDARLAEATAVPGTIEGEISEALTASLAAIMIPPVDDDDTPVGGGA
jgi:hypothetical protein